MHDRKHSTLQLFSELALMSAELDMSPTVRTGARKVMARQRKLAARRSSGQMDRQRRGSGVSQAGSLAQSVRTAGLHRVSESAPPSDVRRSLLRRGTVRALQLGSRGWKEDHGALQGVRQPLLGVVGKGGKGDGEGKKNDGVGGEGDGVGIQHAVSADGAPPKPSHRRTASVIPEGVGGPSGYVP